MENEEKNTKKTTLSHYEEEAEKFEPGEFGVGTLLKAKRNLSTVLNLKTLAPEVHNEGDVTFVLNELIHRETKERALVMIKGEYRVMHITDDFDNDYEILVQGTTEMQWASPEDDEE